VDEVELAQAAVFSLQQAAHRLRTLAGQAQSADLRAQLDALAVTLDEHARELQERAPS
jgi:hypothetical protein